jgi:isoleucyl-tRNA synthetase
VIIKFEAQADPSTKLNANYDWKEVESRVRRFYSEIKAGELVRERLADRKPVGWYEGPPTLNNQPHMGHVRGRIFKDLYYRRSILHGDNLVFRGGWDTQGLPVELQAEKELGLTGNKWENLNKVGMEKLVQACKELIQKYRGDWEELDTLLGLMLDRERAYMTYRDEYIEREWTYLEKAWKEDLLGEGFKVVPYCPSCQTSLSQAELALGGYELLDDPSVYYKVKASDGAFLTVWTTMPFTVVTDEFVGVKPDADYEYAQVGNETWIVASERKEAFAKEAGVTFGGTQRKVKGVELAGLRYAHPLLSEIPGLKELAEEGSVHLVVAEEFVDTTTGTGLVHISPANGEDDFAVAQELEAPVFTPLDDQVRFTPDAGRFAGAFARDADEDVISSLKEHGALIHRGVINHEYPVCWRSGHRLVWLARREYFYWVDRIRDRLTDAAEAVEYYFDGPRNRFLEFLTESPPWCITRERSWGAPLPIWVCSSCGEKTPAFSRKRIIELAKDLPDGPNFELHRPWIDRIVLKCPKCGRDAFREPFVLDTWHNSGSAPYSSFTDEEYAELVPARFLTEGIDQTRGWAYTLLVMNVLRTGKAKAPYRAFLFQGHVLDDQGRKMSKSLGNVIWGLDLLRSNSTDLARFYLTWKSSPEDSLSMDLKEMAARPYQVLNTLYHLHVYLVQNGEVDGFDPRIHTVEWARSNKLLTDVDEWLLSKLTSVEEVVEKAYAEARFNEVCRALEGLIIGQVSQNYVRLVRSDLWKDDQEGLERRLAIYATLGHALRVTDVLLHPVSPFVTEYLFQAAFERGGAWREPLMLEGAGAKPPKGAGDAEAAVECALNAEEASNSARTRAKLKRRWPLKKMIVLVQPEDLEKAKRASGLLGTLCNVGDVGTTTSPEEFPARFELTPSPSRVGVVFKKQAPAIMRKLGGLEGEAALRKHLLGAAERVELPTGAVDVPASVFDFKVTATGQFEVAERGGVFVAIDTFRDDELIAEGLARDLARRLQALRKTKGFNPTELLNSARVAGLEDEELEMLSPLRKDLAFLVRVREVALFAEKPEGKEWAEEDLDGRTIFIDVS